MIDLLFPKPVYRKPDLVSHDQCLSLEVAIKTNLEKSGVCRDNANNVDSSFHTSNHLNELPEFEEFSKLILKEGQHFLKLLSYDNYIIDNSKIQKMWANVSYENDFLFPHNHGDCLIAGVFYVKAPPESTIHFFDNLEKIKTRRSIYNELSYEEFSYNCKTGMMLMFENYMVHGNKKQPAGEKIAISFNIGL